MDRTTIAVSQHIARRVSTHANNIGNRSTTAIVEFMLRKACDFIDNNGYDAFIKIPSSIKKDEI